MQSCFSRIFLLLCLYHCYGDVWRPAFVNLGVCEPTFLKVGLWCQNMFQKSKHKMIAKMISNMCPGHEFRSEKTFYFASAKKWNFTGLYSSIYVTYFVFFRFWNKKVVSPRKLSTHTWNMHTYPDIFISEFFHISKMHFQPGFTCTQVQLGLSLHNLLFFSCGSDRGVLGRSESYTCQRSGASEEIVFPSNKNGEIVLGCKYSGASGNRGPCSNTLFKHAMGLAVTLSDWLSISACALLLPTASYWYPFTPLLDHYGNFLREKRANYNA
jgi:hypothetical protein